MVRGGIFFPVSKNKMKIGIVGLGKMGLLHASILNTLPDVKVKALCEKNPFVYRFAKKILKDISIINDVSSFSGLNLDAIYVTTQPSSHFPVILAIYSKGIAKNIFVEKPLGENAKESLKLYELAQTKNGVNMVGFNRRFSTTFRKAKEILKEGVIGEIFSFKGYAHSSDFFGQKKAKQSRLRGNVVNDLGSHIIDLGLWFFGELEVISCKGDDDTCWFQVKSKNIIGEFDVSWCKEGIRLPEFGFLIEGSNGRLNVDCDMVKLNGKESFVWYKQNLNDNVRFLLGEPDYFREDEAFVKAIITNSHIEPNFYTAYIVDKIIEEVNKWMKG